MHKTRADFPIGTEVRFKESGKEVEVVSVAEAGDDAEYEGPDTIFVQMGGIVQRTTVDKVERV